MQRGCLTVVVVVAGSFERPVFASSLRRRRVVVVLPVGRADTWRVLSSIRLASLVQKKTVAVFLLW